MKIGIYTFHRAHNYGAVLQAYALKTTLEGWGHDVKFVDYWPEYRDGHYAPFNKKLLSLRLKGLRSRMKLLYANLVLLKEKKRRFKKFNLFIEEYLEVKSKVLYKRGEEIPDDCDMYIYGSDQIWRIMSALFDEKIIDEVYLGKYPIGNPNKIAYAASMGIIAIDDRNKEVLKRELPNFKAIGVRESSLKEALENITNKSIAHVLDPVLLLSKVQWLSLIADMKEVKSKKYIFFYHLRKSEMAIAYVKKMAQQMECEVVEFNEGNEPLVFSDRYPGKLSYSSIEFLAFLSGAEFVVSTSFHGVALSLCFERQFVAMGMGNNSGRVASLLNILDLQDRLLTETESETNKFIDIDYVTVNEKLQKQRDHSLAFLLQHINESIYH